MSFQQSCMDVRVDYKEGEHQIIDDSNWKKTKVPWTARRSINHLKKSSDLHWKDWCCLWRSNTLATWSKETNMLKEPWCWKDWKMLGEKRNCQRIQNGWMSSQLSADMSLSKLWDGGQGEAWHSAVPGISKGLAQNLWLKQWNCRISLEIQKMK